MLILINYQGDCNAWAFTSIERFCNERLLRGKHEEKLKPTIDLRCLDDYHVPWVDQSLYSPHRKSSIV